jgi:hypothetical protein
LADAAGRITIISASSMALNETAVVRSAILDRDDELNQALAMYWLNTDRQVCGSSFSNGALLLIRMTVPNFYARIKRTRKMDLHGSQTQAFGTFLAPRHPCRDQERDLDSSLSATRRSMGSRES